MRLARCCGLDRGKGSADPRLEQLAETGLEGWLEFRLGLDCTLVRGGGVRARGAFSGDGVLEPG